MITAAIYARVSSARQKEDQTIASQTAALRATAEHSGLEVPPEWVFEDEGYSGATLIRPALERLRDLAAQIPIDVVLCYSPDRLARRYAYQALLIDEFARVGTEVRFVNGPKGESPEDELLIQFQGMIAEYERAQIVERTRRGKAHRAREGTVNVLSGAPFGYRYLRRCDSADARYEIVEEQAVVVREMFRRYTEDHDSIAELARWLGAQGVATATGKDRWDRSTVWGMLRNPAYAGRAAFLKTMRLDQRARVNRTARLQGQSMSRHAMSRPRDRGDWITIAVPAIVSEDTFELAARRLEDNRRFATRNTKVPSLLMGLVSCQSCGYAYYRTSTRTKKRKLYYYRCLGSDDYRYEHGRICHNKPVRADYLDDLVWGQVTALLADPRLVQAELDRRLEELRAANPATAERVRLELDLTRATKSIERLVQAYQEDLVTLDELRARMPELRAKETSLSGALASLDAQLLDRQTYLTLTENLEGFLSRLRDTSEAATVEDRQRVLQSVVKEVLVGPERVVIRHSIPAHRPFRHGGYRLRLRSHDPALRSAPSRHHVPELGHHPGRQPATHGPDHLGVVNFLGHLAQQALVAEVVKEPDDVELSDVAVALADRLLHPVHRQLGALPRPVAEAAGEELRLKERLDDLSSGLLDHPVSHRRDAERPHPAIRLRYLHPPYRRWDVALRRQQPPAQRHQLVLNVGTKGCNGLAVDARRPSVGPDRRPSSRQIDGIGNGLQQLTHGPAPPCVSATFLAPCRRVGPPAPSTRSAVRRWTLRSPLTWCLLGGVGLGRPLHRTPPPSRSTGRPPTSRRRVSGHYPAFGTTTGQLTPRRASVCFSHLGYSVAYPTHTDPPTGPHMVNRPPVSSGLASSAGTARDPTRSPRITSSALSPHADRNHRP
jgi:DNA invertase Pin-like site-specific DNA recombinase